MGYSPWRCKDSDETEGLTLSLSHKWLVSGGINSKYMCVLS